MQTVLIYALGAGVALIVLGPLATIVAAVDHLRNRSRRAT
jgi:hypothetical protein